MTVLSSDDLTKLQQTALHALEQAASAVALEEWRVEYLGRKGQLPQLLRRVKDLPNDERRLLGTQANTLRVALTAAYEARLPTLAQENATTKSDASTKPGLTMLTGLPETGHLHPLTITIRRIQQIFVELGFMVVEGPLVEEPKYNFDLLNIPVTHPARAETDTFYTDSGAILRTHVSPLQVRAVEEHKLTPPFKFFYYGRTFRAERTDATHETTFHQFEFMVVSKTASLAELKGIIDTFYSRFFGKPVISRLRPGFFPFVEPGLEVDLRCLFCEGEGCRVCKYSGWIEMAGAGMVHPEVLQNMQVDPKKFQGFALGGAVDRLAMFQYGINDIRQFWSGDIRFLKQFS